MGDRLDEMYDELVPSDPIQYEYLCQFETCFIFHFLQKTLA